MGWGAEEMSQSVQSPEPMVKKNKIKSQAMHAHNPKAREAKTGGFLVFPD